MELLEIYDEKGNGTGRLFDRADFDRLGENENMLAVHVYIVDSRGKWLLQKRSLKKKYLPGLWDVTSGAVDPGETSIQAAVREVSEELGIELNPESLKLHCRFKRKHCFIDIWITETSFDIAECVLQDDEVDDAKWFEAVQMLELIGKAEYQADDYLDEIVKVTKMYHTRNAGSI